MVIDMDATLITAHSDEQGAAATFKKGYGHHPLGAWCANTTESLAMPLRPGNAGSNTVSDHIRVLDDAIAQLPASYRRKILIRVDGAGATHDLMTHLERLNRTRRNVRFTVGWAITDADETAIARLPETAWTDSLGQDGTATTGQAHTAELTGLDQRLDNWNTGLRLIVRRTRPSARHAKNLTALERSTGWRYAIVATDIGRLGRVAGSHQPQWLDALHRAHAQPATEDTRSPDASPDVTRQPRQPQTRAADGRVQKPRPGGVGLALDGPLAQSAELRTFNP
ncbi:transposase [Micromonospora sp. LOL_013]|uniref:transposase n=1 Tax=unclassified Micromonospora TaxID=2617518 RepID=UPI003A87ED6D